MQDYNRGIIIGQTTFGKGSVQRFKTTNKGQIKLTDSLYYRITGQPTQLYGVEPNLKIPSLLASEELGEIEYENALKPDNVENAFFVTFNNFDTENYRKSFEQRIYASEYFNKLNEIKRERDSNLFLSLNLEKRKMIREIDRINTLELVNLGRTLSGYEIFSNFDEYQEYVSDDEFILDAEIDQSFKVLLEVIEQNV